MKNKVLMIDLKPKNFLGSLSLSEIADVWASATAALDRIL
jgi:hypothetical protein